MPRNLLASIMLEHMPCSRVLALRIRADHGTGFNTAAKSEVAQEAHVSGDAFASEASTSRLRVTISRFYFQQHIYGVCCWPPTSASRRAGGGALLCHNGAQRAPCAAPAPKASHADKRDTGALPPHPLVH